MATDGPEPEIIMGDRTHILPPGYGTYGLENESAGTTDLPEDFDPTSDKQLRALSDEQVADNLEGLNDVHTQGTGAGNDLAYIFLNPEFRSEADPGAVATTRALLRELVRRTVQMPEWDLTQEYLFGEKPDGK